MISMNDFIDSNENSLRHFLDQVSTVSNEGNLNFILFILFFFKTIKNKNISFFITTAPENVEDLQPTTPIFSVKKDAKRKGKDVEEEPTEYTMSEGILKVPRNVVEVFFSFLFSFFFFLFLFNKIK